MVEGQPLAARQRAQDSGLGAVRLQLDHRVPDGRLKDLAAVRVDGGVGEAAGDDVLRLAVQIALDAYAAEGRTP